MDDASDNAHNPYPWEGWQELGNLQLISPNTWTRKYNFTAITQCNWFLENIDRAPIDAELSTRMKGEVRFIRAYEYFQRSTAIWRFSLGDHYAFYGQEANEVARTPKAEVVQFILTELEAVIPLLPQTYEGSDAGRITQRSCLGLKSEGGAFQRKICRKCDLK